MRAWTLGLALLPAVLTLAPLGASAGQQPNRTPQFGVTLSRDTVTIGEPFEIRVRVRTTLDAKIVFPEAPDTAGTVHARDPRTIVTADSTQWLDQIATYRVAAWNTGNQTARFADVIVAWDGPPKGQLRVPLRGIRVFVRTVLPLDSTLRVPKPARALWEPKAFPWWIVAVAVAALALAYWWWMRRRRTRPLRPVAVVDPYKRAKEDFQRIELMGLLAAGERTRYVALVIEVLRDYLAARHAEATLALTSRELLTALRRHPTVHSETLTRVLNEADLAKFAGLSLPEDRARVVGEAARLLVDREHAAMLASGATEKPQAAA